MFLQKFIHDGCDILVTIYELHYSILPIVQLFKRGSKFYRGGPNFIIEYGLPGPFSMGVHILSDNPPASRPENSHVFSKAHLIYVLCCDMKNKNVHT